MNSSGKSPLLGRVFGVLFGLVFAGFGILFIGFFLHSFRSDSAKRAWPETVCRIVSAEVVPGKDSGGGFNAEVRFETTMNGATVRGTERIHENDYAEALGIVNAHPEGSTMQGRVNPENPAEVVLLLDSGKQANWFALPFMLIPLVFVVIGFGVAWASIRGSSKSKTEAVSLSDSAPGPAARRAGNVAGWLFGVVFVLIGGVLSWIFFVKPVVEWSAARSWVETPCVIESSRVVSVRGDDGTTYRPEILYVYEIDGREHRSSRVSFFGGSSSGRSGKEAFIRSYPVGGRAVCYVDPADPGRAVLVRAFSAMSLLGLIPVVFLVIGLVMLVAMVRGGSKARSANGGLRSRHGGDSAAGGEADGHAATGSLVLKPAMSPIGKALMGILVALFWNGIVGVFVYQFFSGWQRGRPEWFLGVFMIPFVLIGLGLLVWCGMMLLALANPRPRLTIEPGTPCPGGALRLQYGFTGAVQRMERIVVELVGRESATYRRGTDTRTDKSVFSRIPLLETTDRSAMRAGEIEVVLPNDVPPGFKARNNKIEWFLRVRGEIARWPDVDDEFPVQMVAAASDFSAPPTDEDGPELIEGDGLRLGLKGGRDSFLPGETIKGVAAWALDAVPKKAELRLFWYTEGKGTSDIEVLQTEVFHSLESQAVKPFRFELPYEPFSLDGRLVSVRWALELIVRAPKERVLRLDFVMSPTGQAFQIGEVPDEGRRKKGGWRIAGR